jgi:flagellar export protein FliJ
MREARACWPVLVRKAQDQIEKIQNDIGQAVSKVEQLQASHQRLCQLYDEYRQQEQQPQATVMGMQSSMNQRQFMGQLLTLQHRVVQDMAKAQSALAQLRKKRIQAEIELQKMKSLEEQDLKAVQRDVNLYEQRQMDALGVRQFNMRAQN